MLFKFNHRDKMIGQSIEASTELSTANPVKVSLSNNQANKLKYSSTDTLLVLATTSTKSTLFKAQGKPTENNGYEFTIDSNIIKYLDSIDDSITIWITNIDKISQINIKDVPMGSDLIIGSDTDPTGGTDLFIRNTSLNQRSSGTFDGSFRIPAEPYRNWINLSEETDITFKANRADEGTTPDVEVERPLVSEGRATLPKATREELEITPEENTVNIWATTDTLYNPNPLKQKEPRQQNTTKQVSNESNSNNTDSEQNGETHLSEISPITEDITENDNKEETPTDNNLNNTSNSNPNGTDSSNVEMEMSSAANESQSTSEDSPNTKTPSSNNTDTGASNEQLQTDVPTNDSLLGDKEIIPEVNPDLTPVVLLDKDERTQEQWTGHYQKENGDLLCGREYTKAIPDPQRDHYSEVCMDCLQERPGALSEEDITSIFEKITGSKFTDDLPILLDRKKAAEVISVIAANKD